VAEKVVLVCDVCGTPAAETVTIRVGASNHMKDLCGLHLAELLKGSRRPRPGRRPGVASSRRSRGTQARSGKTTRRRTTGRK